MWFVWVLLGLLKVSEAFIPSNGCFWLRKSTCEVLHAGKGFGAAEGPTFSGYLDGFTPSTKAGESKKLGGTYGRIVASKLEAFAALKENKFPIAKDVYCRLSNDDTFWFIGKVIHDTTALPKTEDAVAVLLPLLKEYGRTLRPLDLAGPKSVQAGAHLEIWTALPNSEMDTVQHKNTLQRVDAPEEAVALLNRSVPKDAVGFEPEVYQGGEDGFRVKRNSDGSPMKAPIEVNVKSKDEMGM